MPKTNKYQQHTRKVQSWEDIEVSFKGFELEKLVKHIIETGLSNRIKGSRSMTKLIIGLYDPIELDRESFHITFDIEKNQWRFVYYPMPLYPPEFVRQYSPELGIEKFDNFIKMIGW